MRAAAGASPVRAKGIGEVVAGLRIPFGVGLHVALAAVWLLAGGLVIPFFNLYFLRRHGLPVATIGLIFAAAQAVAAVAVLASGEAAARFGTRRTLIAWMAVYGPLLWVLAAVRDARAGVVLYVIQNLALPASNPLVDQILLERVAEDRQGAVSSWRNAATEGSGLLGASIGGVMLQRGSFTAVFAAAGLIAVAGATALGRRLGWDRRPDPAGRRAP
jgi:predicted MFS family arabinose efflux permease